MPRAHNFSAGPAALPLPVMEQVQRDLLDFRGTGMSVMEMSHRSNTFIEVANSAEQSLRQLLGISEEYHVLFLQGGARLQFAMIPMNLAAQKDVVEYVNTGIWSESALKEAQRLCDAKPIATATDHIPEQSTWNRHSDSKYLYIATNETVSGVQFKQFPVYEDVPLVADASSDLLTRPINVDHFGLIFGCAQKNFGPAGLTIVIVRKDLCRSPRRHESDYLNYLKHAESGSMYNTPNTFAWYLSGLIFDWISAEGGLDEMQRQCQMKSQKLYDLIDSSSLYRNGIATSFRSTVNVTFTLHDDSLNQFLLEQANQVNIRNLKGHRSVGGFRASLYNGVSMEDVDALVSFLTDFEQRLA